MKRTEGLQKVVDQVAKNAFGRSLTESQKADICVFCGKLAKEFRDGLSRKEYGVSGICQACQDKVFGK